MRERMGVLTAAALGLRAAVGGGLVPGHVDARCTRCGDALDVCLVGDKESQTLDAVNCEVAGSVQRVTTVVSGPNQDHDPRRRHAPPLEFSDLASHDVGESPCGALHQSTVGEVVTRGFFSSAYGVNRPCCSNAAVGVVPPGSSTTIRVLNLPRAGVTPTATVRAQPSRSVWRRRGGVLVAKVVIRHVSPPRCRRRRRCHRRG